MTIRRNRLLAAAIAPVLVVAGALSARAEPTPAVPPSASRPESTAPNDEAPDQPPRKKPQKAGSSDSFRPSERIDAEAAVAFPADI